MPTQIGENRAKKMLKANELVLCMGVNELRIPNIAMIAAACGFDAVYIRPRARPDLARNRGRGVRRGIGHGDHADRPGHLARPGRRYPGPRLRRAGHRYATREVIHGLVKIYLNSEI
jgi:hypothetical protein